MEALVTRLGGQASLHTLYQNTLACVEAKAVPLALFSMKLTVLEHI